MAEVVCVYHAETMNKIGKLERQYEDLDKRLDAEEIAGAKRGEQTKTLFETVKQIQTDTAQIKKDLSDMRAKPAEAYSTIKIGIVVGVIVALVDLFMRYVG